MTSSAPRAVRSQPRPGYGPRGPADEHGLRLPEGFRSRLIARGREAFGTNYRWHEASDGMACFPADGGGWVLVSNSETLEGGASAIRFDPGGRPEIAYRILDGTTQNCSGGGRRGDLAVVRGGDGRARLGVRPGGRRRALSRPAMGAKHEAAAVDPGREAHLPDRGSHGRRGVPLHAGALARPLGGPARDRPSAAAGRELSEVPDPGARRADARPGARQHSLQACRGDLARRRSTISTTGDHRVHAYDIASERIDVIYDGLGDGPTPLLRRPAHREPGGRGVRLRGHRDRRDRHRADRLRGPRVEVPPRPAGSRGVGAHGRDVRPVRQPHVPLVAASGSAGTGRRGRARSTRCPALPRFTRISRDGS